jgi:RNA polymerase sigma-70 factor (ECF subfamily)
MGTTLSSHRVTSPSVRIDDEWAFEQHRSHLLRVGYRITGNLADAEDAVQESWLRYAGLDEADRAQLRNVRAWLATVVGRICLDRLSSAAARRERYVGPWLPEPLLTTGSDDEPLAAVVQDEDVRMAAMVVLERLTPPQRVAFVLHEALALPFADIAEVLGCSSESARQHASRARRIVAAADPPPRAPAAEQRSVLAAFADAVARADRDALVALLHPDVVLVNDGGGQVSAARRPVVGADKVARLLLGLRDRHGPELAVGRALHVNGDIGMHTTGTATVAEAVTTFSMRDGLIVGIYGVLAPAKLTALHPGEVR